MSMHNDKHGICKDALSESVSMMLMVIRVKVHWSNAHEWAMSLKVKSSWELQKVIGSTVMVFLDDILIYSKWRKSMKSI